MSKTIYRSNERDDYDDVEDLEQIDEPEYNPELEYLWGMYKAEVMADLRVEMERCFRAQPERVRRLSED